MSPHTFFHKVAQALNNEVQVQDPGDGGTIGFKPETAFQYCVLKSAGAETRNLPKAGAFPVGSMALVLVDSVSSSLALSRTEGDLDTSGNVTATYSAGGTLTLFVVSENTTGRLWRIVINRGGSLS